MIFNRWPCPSNVLLRFNFIFFVNAVTISTGFDGDAGGDDGWVFSTGCGITYGYSTKEMES